MTTANQVVEALKGKVFEERGDAADEALAMLGLELRAFTHSHGCGCCSSVRYEVVQREPVDSEIKLETK